MITVITPFKRKENLPFLLKVLEGKCNWIVLIDDPTLKDIFPSWVTVKLYETPLGDFKSNKLINEFLRSKIEPETQYMVLCDDDSVEDGFFEKIPDKDCVLVSMKRGDNVGPNLHYGSPVHLIASPENLKIAFVGGEQLIVKGKILRNYRYGLSHVGDGEMVIKVAQENEITYVSDAFVLFNFFEDGRYNSFRRKPLVLFVGDYFCAATPRMGKSEWEGNLAASLDASGVADVLTFHFDVHFLTTGRRGDIELLRAVEEFKPDYVVVVIYKELDRDPTTISLATLTSINVPIISIWGDLEAEEQYLLAKSLEPMMTKVIATASKEISERAGFVYLHVPKDPRIFNNPDFKRDIDIVFSGSYGYGREERQKPINYLLMNGIKLVHGGSEGGDHFTTEEYADRYKRAKMALSFSRARGKNVVNARPFEVMACGAMLLEQESLELAKLYTPYVDYVPWTDEVDLLKKVRYYLEHEEERAAIAANGCKKTHELYSAKKFWEKVLER